MIALDSETKAVLSYRVGKRDAVSAYEFIGDLHERIAERHRCQLTTDALEGYFRRGRALRRGLVTPAMEAGLTDHVWTIGELLSVGAAEGRPAA